MATACAGPILSCKIGELYIIRIKDAGIAIRKEGYFLYCRVQKRVGGGGRTWARTHKRKLALRNWTFFVIEKYVEDANQDEKDVPDLVESITRPTDPVKEELRRNLYRMNQFTNDPNYPENQRIQGSNLLGVRKSNGFLPEATASLLASKF